MKRFVFTLITFLSLSVTFAQPQKTNVQPAKPKLVIGIVVDQMRWDYLYRFYDLYKPNGGFRRLLDEGFSCNNTFVPYLPTVTACGHTCIYTGSVPAIHGITGNNWFDNNLKKMVYCVDDNTVQTVGSTNLEVGQMSPRNVFVTTVTDELRLASNFRSKVIGLSMKDRGSIIPAGHAANAAYWYDGKTGNFVTSTYYMKELPGWMKVFNSKKMVDSLYSSDWTLSLSPDVYAKYCDTIENDYSGRPFGNNALKLPYALSDFKEKDYSKISSTPYANDLLAGLAQSAIQAEQLGKHGTTDFLAVSFSSPDYIGHAFGPNSWEILDAYVRLDETLGKFFNYLDKTIGKNQYTVFLSADHGGAHIPEFLQKHNISGGRWDDGEIKKELKDYLTTQFSQPNLINTVAEYDVYLNHPLMDSIKLDELTIKNSIIQYLLKKDFVLNVIDKKNAGTAAVPVKLREMVADGYNPQRSGDLQIIMKTGVMDAGKTGMSHGVWSPDDSHIPLVFYGWGIKTGSLAREVKMTDISATISSLLHIQMPSGCIGNVITEAIK